MRALLAPVLGSRWWDTMTRRGAILAYHGVQPDDTKPAPLHATVSQLAAHLEAMADRGYRFLPLDEMLRRLGARQSVARCVSVTFDDAYAGLDLALPVLQRFQAPATIFVPTGSIESGRPFWWDRLARVAEELPPDEFAAWAARARSRSSTSGLDAVRTRVMSIDAGSPGHEMDALFREGEGTRAYEWWLLPMSWDALRRWLRWDGAACAPHTLTHPVLPRLTEEEQRRQIAESHAELVARVGAVSSIIAYPYGLYDATTIRAARAAGIAHGVTMDRVGCAPGDEVPMRVPRLPFGGTTPVERLGVYLSAPWRWYRRRDLRGGFPVLPSMPDR